MNIYEHFLPLYATLEQSLRLKELGYDTTTVHFHVYSEKNLFKSYAHTRFVSLLKGADKIPAYLLPFADDSTKVVNAPMVGEIPLPQFWVCYEEEGLWYFDDLSVSLWTFEKPSVGYMTELEARLSAYEYAKLNYHTIGA